MVLTKDGIKKYVSHKIRPNSTNLVPKTESWINNDSLLKESIDFHCKNFKGNISYCEKLRHILLDLTEQHICPVCKIVIPLKKECCSTSCAARNPKRKEKIKKTNIEKYGADNWTCTEEGKKKISEIKLNYTKEKKEEILTKREQNNIEKYGIPYLLQDKKYKVKAEKTFIEKYGVNNPYKNSEIIEKIKQTKKNNDEKYPGKVLERQSNHKKKKFKSDFNRGCYHYEGSTPLFTENDYHLKKSEMKYLCNKCNKEFFRHSINITRCIDCYPVNIPQAELELFEYICTLEKDIIKNSRTIISPYELDIFIKNKKIAIEYDGILYHSYGKGASSLLNNYLKEDKKYHLNKTLMCEKMGIQLLHIFENEWIDEKKQKIWKSIINSKIGLNKTIYARKCELRKVDSKNIKEFMNNNHLQGFIPSSECYGLFYNNELICSLTLSKSRYNKKYDWEITRFANKLNINVVGGFSKLLKHFRKNNVGSIITYADRRISNGNLYRKNGFIELHESKPNYFYIDMNHHKNRLILQSRINFQKHKLKNLLKNFDPSLTESENMFNNNFRRIWDCGNLVFVLE